MSLERIHQAIPHRAPFLLVDEIVEWGESRLVCKRQLTGEEFWFQGHYPGQPIMPGVLMCEACLQAGAILLSGESKEPLDEKVPVATRMNNVKFRNMVRPGETIEIEVEVVERVADAFFMTGKVSSNGKVATRLEFAVTLARAK